MSKVSMWFDEQGDCIIGEVPKDDSDDTSLFVRGIVVTGEPSLALLRLMEAKQDLEVNSLCAMAYTAITGIDDIVGKLICAVEQGGLKAETARGILAGAVAGLRYQVQVIINQPAAGHQPSTDEVNRSIAGLIGNPDKLSEL